METDCVMVISGRLSAYETTRTGTSPFGFKERNSAVSCPELNISTIFIVIGMDLRAQAVRIRAVHGDPR